MLVDAPADCANQLMASLPTSEAKALLSQCETVEVDFGETLAERDKAFVYAYFPSTCFISLITVLNGHPPLGMGLIGNEGMLGGTLALGVDKAPTKALVQGAGTALRISASKLKSVLAKCPVLQNTLQRYVYATITQTSQAVACNHFHEIEPRLARWLLMTQDRAHTNHFHLTHEFLADMLGVRRSGITVAAGMLKQKKLIRYVRGEISVLDRRGLEAVSCECYSAVNKGRAQRFA